VRSLIPPRLRPVLRRIVLAALARTPAISHRDRIIGVDRAHAIDPTARLTILDADVAPSSRIELGRDVFLGRQVELTAARGGSIRIDDDTSIQDASIVFGNVRIGAHCLFGKYCFVASGGHSFRSRPEWLIRDQDRLMLSQLPSPAENEKTQVRIEDDCWIAQSVVVSPGIYIGRGAVVGANAVVTSDIGPYEIHGGTPNRRLGMRLTFEPPRAIDAGDDGTIPYFYRGFRLGQQALRRSRTLGIVEARPQACIVLARAPGARLVLSGLCHDAGGCSIQLRIDGTDAGMHRIAAGAFEIEAVVPPAPMASAVPRPLAQTTYIEIDTVGAAAPRYGIRSAKLTGGA
ncbi:MAG: acyltransferase, partial [Stellaceae bacterium]